MPDADTGHRGQDRGKEGDPRPASPPWTRSGGADSAGAAAERPGGGRPRWRPRSRSRPRSDRPRASRTASARWAAIVGTGSSPYGFGSSSLTPLLRAGVLQRCQGSAWSTRNPDRSRAGWIWVGGPQPVAGRHDRDVQVVLEPGQHRQLGDLLVVGAQRAKRVRHRAARPARSPARPARRSWPHREADRQCGASPTPAGCTRPRRPRHGRQRPSAPNRGWSTTARTGPRVISPVSSSRSRISCCGSSRCHTRYVAAPSNATASCPCPHRFRETPRTRSDPPRPPGRHRVGLTHGGRVGIHVTSASKIPAPISDHHLNARDVAIRIIRNREERFIPGTPRPTPPEKFLRRPRRR